MPTGTMRTRSRSAMTPNLTGASPTSPSRSPNNPGSNFDQNPSPGGSSQCPSRGSNQNQERSSSSPKKVTFSDTIPPVRGGTKQPSKSGSTTRGLWGRRRGRILNCDPTNSNTTPPQAHDTRSRRAADALNRLQGPNSYTATSTAWAPQDTEILSDNIGVLQRSVDETPPPSKKGRKRRRSEAIDPDDSEPDDPAGAQTKRIKKSNKVYVKPRIDLVELAPQPLRIDYKPHPLGDRSDQWFITMFNKLFKMCDRFAIDYFGVHDLEKADFFEPWEANLTPEFISWAEQVAEEDRNVGGWDFVLRNTAQRGWLVMGILMRALKIKVFDTDLWGANEEQSELLFGIEKALLNREGFQRTELRSQTVRKILGRAPVTQNFYTEIATLTAQVSLLFKPLSDYLYSIPPSPEQTLPNFEDQYQALHNIISTAAYLSICIRLSPTIFYFTEISLGEAYDPDDQWNLEMNYYTSSKQAAVDLFQKTWTAWRDKCEKAEQVMKKFEDDGTTGTKKRAYERATEAYNTIVAQVPLQLGLLYRPMTKISVWPVITRYKAGSEQDDVDELNGEKKALSDRDGFRIYQISKAAVVCYFGERERWNKASLSEFLEAKRRKLRGGLLGLGARGVATLVVLGAGWMVAQKISVATA